MRWAAAGYPIVLGSRSCEKAAAAAREIKFGNGRATGPRRTTTQALHALRTSSSSRYRFQITQRSSTRSAARSPQDRRRYHCAAGAAQSYRSCSFPPKARLRSLLKSVWAPVRASSRFHHVAAAKLRAGGAIDATCLCSATNAKRATRSSHSPMQSARAVSTAGPLPTRGGRSVDINPDRINRRYKVDGAGIRITGTFANTTSS
jgi:hypothetical protein